MLCAAMGTLPSPALAQWTVDKARSSTDQTRTARHAVVRSKDGHAFRIYLDTVDKVWAELVLPSGLTRLAAHGCPTYRIDEGDSKTGKSPDGTCDIRGRTVRFEIGELRDARVRSSVLSGLMNGSRLEVVFHLDALGYESAKFSLRGSKQAINRILGGNTQVSES